MGKCTGGREPDKAGTTNKLLIVGEKKTGTTRMDRVLSESLLPWTNRPVWVVDPTCWQLWAWFGLFAYWAYVDRSARNSGNLRQSREREREGERRAEAEQLNHGNICGRWGPETREHSQSCSGRSDIASRSVHFQPSPPHAAIFSFSCTLCSTSCLFSQVSLVPVLLHYRRNFRTPVQFDAYYDSDWNRTGEACWARLEVQ